MLYLSRFLVSPLSDIPPMGTVSSVRTALRIAPMEFTLARFRILLPSVMVGEKNIDGLAGKRASKGDENGA
jgi:hypothetical protein